MQSEVGAETGVGHLDLGKLETEDLGRFEWFGDTGRQLFPFFSNGGAVTVNLLPAIVGAALIFLLDITILVLILNPSLGASTGSGYEAPAGTGYGGSAASGYGAGSTG